jgi:hypothetical protein
MLSGRWAVTLMMLCSFKRVDAKETPVKLRTRKHVRSHAESSLPPKFSETGRSMWANYYETIPQQQSSALKGAIIATQKLASRAFDAPCTTKTPIVVHEFMQGAVGNELERMSASLHLAIILQRPLVIGGNDDLVKSGPCAGQRAVSRRFKWFRKYNAGDLFRQSNSCQKLYDAHFCQWSDKALRVEHAWGGLDMDGGGWPREYGGFPAELKKSYIALKVSLVSLQQVARCLGLHTIHMLRLYTIHLCSLLIPALATRVLHKHRIPLVCYTNIECHSCATLTNMECANSRPPL